jgi:hypothetical protein
MAALAVLGAVVPYTALAAFISQHGIDVGVLLRQVFSTPGSTFFGLDVVMSAIAVLAALLFDWRQVRMPWLVAVAVATVAVGPSCGLPLWLALRRSDPTS